MSTEKEIVVSGKRAQEVADALNATNIKVLKLTQKTPLHITTLAKMLSLSEPYMSETIRMLENLNLINIKYEKGERGIRKIISSNLEKITILLKDE